MDKKKYLNILNELKKFRINLSKEIPIEKIILFGSYASGSVSKNSDIDLIIVSKYFRKKRFRYRALGFYKYWNLDYPVDFLCYTPEEFNKLSKRITIVREATKNGIKITG